MQFRTTTTAIAIAACAFAAPAVNADIIDITITFENLAPDRGTFHTPVWFGIHNGQFDIFNLGQPASLELERIAEDGDFMPLGNAFMNSGFGSAAGALGGGPLAPGAIVSQTITIDTEDPLSRYFSFASMVIPSNDAFVGNDDPLGHELVDGDGNFTPVDFFITGAMVLDAGTEVNDEIPMNTAFFGQMDPNTGVDEGGVVHNHPGYLGSFGNPNAPQSILADPMFAGADFTLAGYPIGRITIVPAPAAGLALGAIGGLGLARRRRAR